MSRLIDNGEFLDDTPFSHPVEHEIDRPDLVGCQGAFQRMPVSSHDLLKLASFHL